jgi:hypothetical protein
MAGPAATFMITAAVIAVAGTLVVPVVKRAGDAGAKSGGASAGERKGLRVDAGVGRVMVVSGMRSFVRGLWLPLATVVALELMGLAASAVGLLMAAAGIGTLTALPASRLLVGRHSLLAPLAVALALCGVPLLPHRGGAGPRLGARPARSVGVRLSTEPTARAISRPATNRKSTQLTVASAQAVPNLHPRACLAWENSGWGWSGRCGPASDDQQKRDVARRSERGA